MGLATDTSTPTNTLTPTFTPTAVTSLTLAAGGHGGEANLILPNLAGDERFLGMSGHSLLLIGKRNFHFEQSRFDRVVDTLQIIRGSHHEDITAGFLDAVGLSQ